MKKQKKNIKQKLSSLFFLGKEERGFNGERVQRPSGDIPLRRRRLQLHTLRIPPPPQPHPLFHPHPHPQPPLHVLRHRRIRTRFLFLLLLHLPQHQLLLLLLRRRLLRRRAAAPRGARHQHPPDLEQDRLHPQPLQTKPQPPLRRRPLRPLPPPHGLRPLPAARREVPLRHHPRLGLRLLPLHLPRLQHARRTRREPRPVPVLQLGGVLHAPDRPSLGGVAVRPPRGGGDVRSGGGVRAVVDEGLHGAAGGDRGGRGRAQGAHRLRLLAHLRPLLVAHRVLIDRSMEGKDRPGSMQYWWPW